MGNILSDFARESNSEGQTNMESETECFLYKLLSPLGPIGGLWLLFVCCSFSGAIGFHWLGNVDFGTA